MHQNCKPEYESMCSEDTVVLFLIGMSWLFSKSSIKLILLYYSFLLLCISYFLSQALWFCVCALRCNGNRHLSHEL